MRIFPEIKEFTKRYSEEKPQIVWTKLPADIETPVSVALKLADEKYCCLFESVEQGANRGRYSFIAFDPDLIWSCDRGNTSVIDTADGKEISADSGDVMGSLRSFINDARFDIDDDLPSMAAGVFGYLGYDMVRYMEEIPDANKEVIGVPESIFMRPRMVVIFDSVRDEMIVANSIYDYKAGAEDEYKKAQENIRKLLIRLGETNLEQNYLKDDGKISGKELSYSSNTSREEYHEMVEKAKEYILAGDIFQVVPSQRFTVDFEYDGFALYRVLRSLNPSPYSFYMKMDDFSLVGSSPEILVRAKDGKTTVRPIAGTRKRGANSKEDAELAGDLLSDNKELSEHLMLIDLGRNDMGRVSKIGSVKVTEQMIIEYYSHVMHIVSNVEGELLDGIDALDAVIAGFPVGTVSGAPKIRAMEIIDELEKERRSFYAGGVGYFSADGNVDTCIALRTGLVKDGKLYVQAGGGVVADSDPEAEYQESCNKAKALIKAAEEVVRRGW